MHNGSGATRALVSVEAVLLWSGILENDDNDNNNHNNNNNSNNKQQEREVTASGRSAYHCLHGLKTETDECLRRNCKRLLLCNFDKWENCFPSLRELSSREKRGKVNIVRQTQMPVGTDGLLRFE